jgi:hypothetical protein
MDGAPRRVRPGIEISPWPELKFARALQHARLLQSQIEAWNAITPISTDKTVADDGLSADIVLRLRTEPPLHDWSLTLGDCLHNLRSSLDALAWEFSHLDGRSPAKPRDVQFPICNTSAEWNRALNSRIESVPSELQGRIKLTQPFMYEQSGNSALLLLSKLDIQDKHRSQIAMTVRSGGIVLADMSVEFQDSNQIPDPPLEMTVAPAIEVKDGAILMRVSSSARMNEISAPMTISPTFTIINDGSEIDLQSSLNSVLSQVRGTLSIAYFGIQSPEGPDDAGWTPFNPTIVDSLE